MVNEGNVPKSSNVMDWKYKQWLRIVTVVAFVLIFLLWGGFLLMSIFISVQFPLLEDFFEVYMMAYIII